MPPHCLLWWCIAEKSKDENLYGVNAFNVQLHVCSQPAEAFLLVPFQPFPWELLCRIHYRNPKCTTGTHIGRCFRMAVYPCVGYSIHIWTVLLFALGWLCMMMNQVFMTVSHDQLDHNLTSISSASEIMCTCDKPKSSSLWNRAASVVLRVDIPANAPLNANDNLARDWWWPVMYTVRLNV